MKKIRILEIIDRPFLGGGQRNVLSIAASLNRNTFDIAVCSDGGGPFVDEVKRHGISHFSVPFSKKVHGKTQKLLIQVFKNNHFDIVHTHGGVAGFFGRRAARKCGVPVILHTLHGIHYLHYRNPVARLLYILLERWYSRFTHGMILVSEADQKQAVKYRLCSESKMRIINNGINFSEIKNLSTVAKAEKKAVLGVHLKKPVLGTVARLHRQKGIPFLVQAMARISKELPDAVLLIVGGGPQEEKLKSLIRDLALDEKIIFLGEREDAMEILSLFDIFILPSLWEGLPYVLMEAAGMAKPVVATSIDGVREMIRDGETGLLVPAEDANGLAVAVLRLVRDRGLADRLAQNLKKHITTAYGLTRMTAEVENYYKYLASEVKDQTD